MLLEQVMAGLTPNPDYRGKITNDDNVLAINGSSPYDPDAPVDGYFVVQVSIEGVDASLNAENSTKQYLRSGKSTTKTGTQRTFSAKGDRFIGDEFQNYIFAHDRMYGVGQDVVTDYVFFNVKNFKGEKGQVSILVNSDGSGNAGATAAIDVSLNKTGETPTEFTYGETDETP
ncbi:hypothetical protein AGMMS49975_22590 [Clostridia bacterium]|nr:hypothetical protein AGMMS49975_22590 [Clostridia bacterium]